MKMGTIAIFIETSLCTRFHCENVLTEWVACKPTYVALQRIQNVSMMYRKMPAPVVVIRSYSRTWWKKGFFCSLSLSLAFLARKCVRGVLLNGKKHLVAAPFCIAAQRASITVGKNNQLKREREMCQESIVTADAKSPIHWFNACLALSKKLIYKVEHLETFMLNLVTVFRINGLAILIFVSILFWFFPSKYRDIFAHLQIFLGWNRFGFRISIFHKLKKNNIKIIAQLFAIFFRKRFLFWRTFSDIFELRSAYLFIVITCDLIFWFRVNFWYEQFAIEYNVSSHFNCLNLFMCGKCTSDDCTEWCERAAAQRWWVPGNTSDTCTTVSRLCTKANTEFCLHWTLLQLSSGD